MDNRDVLDLLLPRLRVVRGPDARGEYVAWCPIHPDGQGTPPHSPNFNVSERGAYCHACKWGGGLRKLAKELGIELPRNGRGHSGMTVAATYQYVDEYGVLLFEVVRKTPKGFTQRRPDGTGGWIWGLDGTRRVPYRLPELLANMDATVFVVEGEKDVDRLRSLGLVATTNSEGAEKWRPEHSEFLRGRDVVILPDNDEPGRKHARQVAASLTGVAGSVKVVELDGLPPKGDVSDWLNAGHTLEDLESEVAKAAGTQPNVAAHAIPPVADADPKRTQADEMIVLANRAGLTLLRDTQGEPHLQIAVDDHREVWPAAGRAVRAWLTRLYHAKHDRAPNLTAISTAINTLQAHARLEGREVSLENRTAAFDGAIYYDLADGKWQTVRVTTEGWEIVMDPPPTFRRYAHQMAQIIPHRAGTVDKLFEFINISDPGERLLLAVYVVAALIPDIPHPILIVHGPQGSSKTTMSRLLRNLVDPSMAPVQSLPDKPEQLVQSLAHNWMPVFDNVSGLPGWASDMLCRAATGEGFTKRALYTDDEDFIWTFRRCPILNGINVTAVKPDLIDRAIIIGLERIDSQQRRSEEELWAEFETQRPFLLGAMLTALTQAMREKPNIAPWSLPRMADFAHWGQAIAVALGHAPTDFVTAYEENIKRQSTEVISAHPLAVAVLEFVDTRGQWSGSATDLLTLLDELAGKLHLKTDDRGWPSQPNQLSRRLNELSVTLAEAGVKVKVRRDRKGSQVELTRIPGACDDAEIIVTPSSRPNSMDDNGR